MTIGQTHIEFVCTECGKRTGGCKCMSHAGLTVERKPMGLCPDCTHRGKLVSA